MNITDISQTSLHKAFEESRKSAMKRGMRVTGSELVGLVPKKVMIEAGKYFLAQQGRSTGIAEEAIIDCAIHSLGLNELGPFDPKKKIIEYLLEDEEDKLVDMNLTSFANETASESPAPGGGSISAYIGALGASLGSMVANLSAHKRGWDDQVEFFSEHAETGQYIKDRLLQLVDEDTEAFNKIMDANRLPKGSEEEKEKRRKAIVAATKNAIETPLEVMQVANSAYPFLKTMAQKGNPNSVSDAGVGALACRAAVHGAFLNVKINCAGFEDEKYVARIHKKAESLLKKSDSACASIIKVVDKIIDKS